jgi:hypothetical protein
MPATEQPIYIEQGADFSLTLTVGTGFNGMSPRGKLRDSFGGSLLATFAFTTVSGGQTVMSLSAALTGALSAPVTTNARQRKVMLGFYEVEIPNGAAVSRTHQGEAYLSREATT